MKLFEYGRGADVAPDQFPILYNLSDYIGFAYAIESNSLRSRGSYVSTTWDPNMNHVVGRHGTVFKMVLNGRLLIEDYGAFHYDDSGIEVGSNGSRKRVSHNENEIGVNTRAVDPLSKYHLGTILNFDLFTEDGLQWLLYRNKGSDGGFMSEKRAATMQAIHIVYDHVFVRHKPIWYQKMGKPLANNQLAYLKDVYEVSERNLPFAQSLEIISDKYPISDWRKNVVDRETYIRRHMAPQMVKIINDYYQNRWYADVDLVAVRSLLDRCIKMLKLGSNAEAVIMHEIDVSGLLNPTTPAVIWGGIITDAMDGDIDEVIEMIRYEAKNTHKIRKMWDERDGDPFFGHAMHAGTQFGRGASADW